MNIKNISYLYENIPSRRQLKIKLSTGSVIRAQSCHESWEQWGGTKNELWHTMSIVESHNDWLHGGERPIN